MSNPAPAAFEEASITGVEVLDLAAATGRAAGADTRAADTVAQLEALLRAARVLREAYAEARGTS